MEKKMAIKITYLFCININIGNLFSYSLSEYYCLNKGNTIIVIL